MILGFIAGNLPVYSEISRFPEENPLLVNYIAIKKCQNEDRIGTICRFILF